MEYVEFLRIRSSLLWHVGIIAVIALFIMSFGSYDMSIDVNGSKQLMGGTGVSWGSLATIASFFSAIFASSAGTSLNRENPTREISWTKPLPRTILALRFVLIDLCGVAIAYAAALAAVVTVVRHMHIAAYFDAESGIQLVLGLGIGVMWYALIQVISCTLPPGARALGGVMWPVALGVGGLTQVPGITGALARLVNVLNPLSYLSNTSSGNHVFFAPETSPDMRALIVWGFSAVFLAIAVAIWPKAEV